MTLTETNKLRKLISTQVVVQPPGLEKNLYQLQKTHIHAGRCSTPRTGKEKSNNQLKKTHIHAGRCSTPRTGKEKSNKSAEENSYPRRSLFNPQDWGLNNDLRGYEF